ncbi:response regulator [Algibacter mikhailovii]|uniref:response regulator n=1 Tax=Algibacter mikhailovii TaxID=425498 RepID=UPI0024951E8A|nr:response regulator [Algibacter mikhailovii]
MNLVPMFIKSIKKKKKLSFFILFCIGTILTLGYFFLEKKIYTETAALFLFVLAILQVFGLQYFLKNQLKNDVKLENFKLRIDELKESLKQAEKFADHKSIYLSNMSYEIRIPLSTVLGMLDMLKQTELNPDQQAQVEIAEHSSMHLLQLVNMVIDNAEVEQEPVKLNLETVDLEADLTKLFKVFEYQMLDKGLDFKYEFLSEEKEKFFVLADSARIQQVLINLINNAIKFTHLGEVSIIVDQTVGIDETQIVTFYIKDTGVGMREQEVKRILANSELDYDTSMMRDYRGGGIGLSISNELVKLMGGDLKLETKENEGSTVYFSLPLKKTLSIKADLLKDKPVFENKYKVLVAEDNKTNQKVIEFLLERQGAICSFAKNGVEALDMYKNLDFNMVFMDIYMPDMDGYQATRHIKQTDKYSKEHTPIIAVSASAFDEDIENAKKAGIDDFLAKPIEVSKLRALLIKYSSTNASA